MAKKPISGRIALYRKDENFLSGESAHGTFVSSGKYESKSERNRRIKYWEDKYGDLTKDYYIQVSPEIFDVKN